MSAILSTNTFWLTATNLVLGLAVIFCISAILWFIARDVRLRRKQKKEESLVPPDYLDGLSDFGVTITNRTEVIDEMEEA